MQFREDGGLFSIVPGTPMTMVIYHPDFPKALRKELEERIDGRATFIFVDTLNFEGEISQDVYDDFKSLLPALLEVGPEFTVSLSPVVTLLQVMSSKASAKQLNTFESLFKSLPGLARGCICFLDQRIWIDQAPPKRPLPETATDLQRPITEEDITDLKITLQGGKDEDIWKMFE